MQGGVTIATALIEFWNTTILPNLTSFLIGAAVFVAVVVIWLIKDTSRRGANTALWVIFAVVGLGAIPLVIYLLVRDPLTLDDHLADKLNSDVLKLQRSYYAFLIDEQDRKCPVCGHDVTARYRFCPSCTAELHKVCPGCGELLESNWRSCPHCGYRVLQSEEKGASI
jgi:RNA polymerase subunit RPABC4/transcription elongation factor Spt4